MPSDRVLAELETAVDGLSNAAAAARIVRGTRNRRNHAARHGAFRLLLGQFKSPITLILILAAGLSYALHDRVDSLIIIAIIGVSALLGFWQEYGASSALEKLLSLVSVKSSVLRDGLETMVPTEAIVPGDVLMLQAGASLPGDCLLLGANDLHVDEAALTGETFPVEKQPGVLDRNTPLAQRTNCLFQGTHVVSGTGRAAVVKTGATTEFGKVAARLRLRAPETHFERGVRRFGIFLMEVTLMLVIAIFAVNVFMHKPMLEAFLFSLALAVGLTPQLLPAIITVNLSRGAKRMAGSDVIVRRLASIENFGTMNVLCCDKTGTLTVGTVSVDQAVGVDGRPNDKALLYAALNAAFETGFANPIDEAIRQHSPLVLDGYQKLDECPYDFIRKRLSILIAHGERRLLVTKGAVDQVLAACSLAELPGGGVVPLSDLLPDIIARHEQFGQQGLRTLGVAYRDLSGRDRASKGDEHDMVYLGALVLSDPPKDHIAGIVQHLRELGVTLKMITGDNRRVAAAVGQQVGLSAAIVLTGGDLRNLSDAALMQRVGAVEIFAEVEPNQKERIILACQKAGNVVGYMGDGINDATALHAADVGISVDQAVDVAKEAADIVLLQHDLGVLADGIREGRRTFANTMKYIYMATSANFGNMFSMAGASLIMTFLPLLPKQILLMNLLTDLPEMTIAEDSVDEESVTQPQQWNIRAIRNFMLVFGTLSSLFDFLTFAVLLLLLRADVQQFRTAWFVESVLSASLVVFVIRTRRPLLRSRPSRLLVMATLFTVGTTLVIPWTPLSAVLGLHPLPARFMIFIFTIIAGYLLAAEGLKALTVNWLRR